MNQKGRDFLSKKVEEIAKREIHSLGEGPKRPNLEDSLKAFIMTSKDIFLNPADMVLNLRRLIKDKEFQMVDSYNRRRRDDDDDFIKMDPWAIFKKPKDFIADQERYEAALATYIQKMADIENHKEMLLMKIQIGSDEHLAPLVQQADAMGSLQIMNSRVMMLSEGKKS